MTDKPKAIDAPRPGEMCAHEIVPEIMRNPGAMDGIRIKVLGHLIGEPDDKRELASIVMAAPSGAVLASQILDETAKSDEFTQMLCALALARCEADKNGRTEDADQVDFLMSLMESVSGGGLVEIPEDDESETSDPKPVKFDSGDQVRIMKFDSGPKTFAPLDNRNEFPEDMGGYL